MEQKKSLLDKAGQLSGIAGQVINGVNLVKGLFTNRKKEEARQDERQLKQQQELLNQQIAGNKSLADYEQELKMKMWHDTNYTAQLKEADKAGISKAAAIGGGGSGVGQGASVSGVSGGQAADAAGTQMAGIQQQMAMAQIANMSANTEKTKAETRNIGADTEGREFHNKANTDEVLDAIIAGKVADGMSKREEAKMLQLANNFEEWLQKPDELTGQSPKERQVRVGINQGLADIQMIDQKIKESGANINLSKAEIARIGSDTALKEQLKTQLDKINPLQWEELKTNLDMLKSQYSIWKKDPKNTQVGRYIEMTTEQLGNIIDMGSKVYGGKVFRDMVDGQREDNRLDREERARPTEVIERNANFGDGNSMKTISKRRK